MMVRYWCPGVKAMAWSNLNILEHVSRPKAWRMACAQATSSALNMDQYFIGTTEAWACVVEQEPL